MPDTQPAARPAISGISSMATQAVLAELASLYQAHAGHPVAIQSIGGLDAARRVQAGEAFDLVVLASEAIDRLMASDHLVAGSKVDLARSAVAVAVRAGDPKPDIASEDACRRAVQAARTVGCSTGPSGVALATLFERWGITGDIRDRVVTAPPGVPVGALVARGDVALGFQQLSELIHIAGIEVVGPLPAGIQIVTTFSGALGRRGRHPDEAAALLAFMASPAAAAAKRRQGMEPA